MSHPEFTHTGEFCRDGGGGYEPDCWACDPSHYDAALREAREAERERCAKELVRWFNHFAEAHTAEDPIEGDSLTGGLAYGACKIRAMGDA